MKSLHQSFHDLVLDYIHSDKGTEGVTVRSVNPRTKEEETVLKYKQSWAVENGRVFDKSQVYNNVNEVESLCLGYDEL